MVDASCYVGYKAIRFADAVGPTGKVIAIELMRDNYDLLVRNIEANELQDVVVPFVFSQFLISRAKQLPIEAIGVVLVIRKLPCGP